MVLLALTCFVVAGCGGSEKEEFVSDATKTLDDLEKKVEKSDKPDMVKAGAKTAIESARKMVEKVKEVDEGEFEKMKDSVEKALKNAEEAVNKMVE
jgi:biopolymer transport protein ExbB/TolQ